MLYHNFIYFAHLTAIYRQRVAIARVLLKNPAILLSDEGTSSLDSASERTITETIKKEMKHTTSILIAHRLPTIQHADQIIVLGTDGTIKEVGKHENLLKIENGFYHELWHKQMHSKH